LPVPVADTSRFLPCRDDGRGGLADPERVASKSELAERRVGFIELADGLSARWRLLECSVTKRGRES
jgi:hypothetical protein